jgi:hypothetical protein
VTSSEFSNVLLTLAAVQLVIVIVNTRGSPVPEGGFLGITYGIPKRASSPRDSISKKFPAFSEAL